VGCGKILPAAVQGLDGGIWPLSCLFPISMLRVADVSPVRQLRSDSQMPPACRTGAGRGRRRLGRSPGGQGRQPHLDSVSAISRLCLGYVSAVSRLYPAAASRLCLAGSESMKEPSVSVKGRFEFMVICCGIFFACAYLRIFWSICAEGRGRAR